MKTIVAVAIAVAVLVGSANAANIKEINTEMAKQEQEKAKKAIKMTENCLKMAAVNRKGEYKVTIDKNTGEVIGFKFLKKIKVRSKQDKDQAVDFYKKKIGEEINKYTQYKSTVKCKMTGKDKSTASRYYRITWTVAKKKEK